MTRVLLAMLALSLLSRAAPAPPASSTASNSSPALAAAQDLESRYQRLLELDDQALEEIDGWIKSEESRIVRDGTLGTSTLRERIRERVRPVREAYDAFLVQHPNHAKAHLAYASFLMETGDETAGVEHMEKARELNPRDPAAWNNLANHYGHRGPVTKAFEYYTRAIELSPNEPVYYQNLATTVFLFRKDAREFYSISEPQVFDKALALYRQALKLDPTNFLLASDLAQTYYGIHIPPTNAPEVKAATRLRLCDDAIDAWKTALRLAGDDVQREGVHVHIARNQFLAGRHTVAREELALVTNALYREVKGRLLRSMDRKETNDVGKVLEAERPALEVAPSAAP